MPPGHIAEGAPPMTYQQQTQLLLIAMWRLKVFAFLVAGFLIANIVLGFILSWVAFFAGNAFLRLAYIYDPAFQLLGRVLGIKNMPAHLARPSTGTVLIFSFLALFWLGAAGFGTWAVLHIGFCNQNFLCLIPRLVMK